MPKGPARIFDKLELCSVKCLGKIWANHVSLTNQNKKTFDANVYDEDYYLRGKESGKSLYENYRWMPELTIPMARAIVSRLGIGPQHTILDYGCSRGYLVKAFCELDLIAYGIDVSEWAISNADELVKHRLKCTSDIPPEIDWIIAKDVLEHVPNVAQTIDRIMNGASVGVFAVIPLSAQDGEPYIIPDYELDVTHIHRLTLASWAALFIRHGWSVECSYRARGIKENYHGWMTWVKDVYDLWRQGNGFIIARRI